jgi:glycosyltransferase involved in cell wall biosynthesis
VIGAQAWGIGDVIRHELDGLLVPFGNVVALSAAIDRLLASPDERLAMGDSGRRKVYAAHTWKHSYAATRELYRRLAGTER